MKKYFTPKIIIIILVMATLITASALYFHQSFFRILPLYISLFVMILSANVSRYAYLTGGLNSILYAVIYFYYGVYGVAFQAMFFSFPVQIITFIRWKKDSVNNDVKLKKMNLKQRIITVFAFLVCWSAVLFILNRLGSSYAITDTTSSLLGILISILTAMAYIEYTYLMIPSGIMNIVLYIQMIADKPEQTPYLIYGIYSFICITVQFMNARKLHKEQNKINK